METENRAGRQLCVALWLCFGMFMAIKNWRWMCEFFNKFDDD